MAKTKKVEIEDISVEGIEDIEPETEPPQNSQEGNQSTSSGSQQQPSDSGSNSTE